MAGHAGPLSLDPVRMVPGRVPYFFLREGMNNEARDKFQDDRKETVAGWCSTLTLLLMCSSFCRGKKRSSIVHLLITKHSPGSFL